MQPPDQNAGEERRHRLNGRHDADQQTSPPDYPVAYRKYTLRERISLTYRYHGGWSLALRAVTFPLRLTPLKARLERTRRSRRPALVAATRWYRAAGRPVTIVIPSYRDYAQVATLIGSLRKTTSRERVEIVVCDDASGREHLAALRTIKGITIVAGERNAGFAANVNRGLAAADPAHDVVLLNPDMVAQPGWLACLQYAAGDENDIGIVGGKLLSPDGRIQSAGTIRNQGAREWFDHRYRLEPSNYGPANVPGSVMSICGSCMYLKRALLNEIGGFDEAYTMGYEDVDLCLRTWQAGFKVMYFPEAQLTDLGSATRRTALGERELASQRYFWQRWGDFFDAREVHAKSGALRVIYVTEGTGVGGGHRDIFEHLNRLRERGHNVELWSLGERPSWFDLQAPVRTFLDYDELVAALAPLDAIKVATWWYTASPVWQASVLRGIPVYLVQDIETSYYQGNIAMQDAVLSWYRPEFRYMTISSWNRDRLRELGLDAVLIPPGIDLENFRPLADVERRDDMLLALGRSHPLKNLPLTLKAWRALPEPRPELCLFGIEPDVGDQDPRIRYVEAPSDAEVNELFNQATIFVQTSTHEGFCLPALEAMATGGAVVCTDAHGNRDFCTDGENCLMPVAEAGAVASAITRLLDDRQMRRRLGEAGIATAADYSWPRRIDALERFMSEVAAPKRIAPSTEVVPEASPARAAN
ncbi:MAG: glycosyltransferase [Solirubrobacteraceae bacterium]